MRRPLALVLVTLLALAAFACGSGGGAGPQVASGSSTGGSGSARDATADDGASAEPPRKPCADGSCVECGDGVCPTGFYCEKAKGATGCAWVAPCAEKPTCSCVAPHAKACSCEDRGGVAFVTCG